MVWLLSFEVTLKNIVPMHCTLSYIVVEHFKHVSSDLLYGVCAEGISWSLKKG